MKDDTYAQAVRTLDGTIEWIAQSLAEMQPPTNEKQLDDITELADQLTSITDARQALLEERGRRL
jgi:hypothetical protein